MSTTPQPPGDGPDGPVAPTGHTATGSTLGGRTSGASTPAGSAPTGGALTEDEAVARVRAADKAAASTPGPELRAAVDSRIAADARTSTTGAPGGTPPRDEVAAARARRWTSWPARVAGAAAAALVIGGGGGFALGAAGDAPPPPAAGAITLGNGGQGGGESGGGQSGALPEAAMAEPGGESAAMAPEASSARVATDQMTWPAWSGRTVFSSQGLSGDAGTAPAWTFDPSQAFTEDVVAAAAAALGISGAPRLENGVWFAGAVDGSGPNFSVYPDGTASFNYYDPAKDPWSCPTLAGGVLEEELGSPAADAAVEPGDAVIEPDPCSQRDLGAAPKGDVAAAAVRDAIAALGFDPVAFELVVDDTEESAWTFVAAHHVVGGQRTGAVWNASLTGAGLQSLYGSLAPVISLGEYEVVSAAEAVERFADPRFGSGWGGPIAYATGAEPAGPDAGPRVEEPSLPATVPQGAAIAWPVDEVTIVEARLGAAMHTQPDGATLLVPTYELMSTDGGIWSMIAVAEHHLDLSPVQR